MYFSSIPNEYLIANIEVIQDDVVAENNDNIDRQVGNRIRQQKVNRYF